LNFRKTSRILIAGMAIMTALSITACSDDSNKPAAKSTTSTTAAATRAANLPPQPTPEELNTQFQTAIDPNVPATEKADMIQGGADEALIGKFTDFAKSSGATVTITKVEPYGMDELLATASFSINGQPGELQPVFVAENGKWKLKKQWVCDSLGAIDPNSVPASCK
jgi:hypothetical protein